MFKNMRIGLNESCPCGSNEKYNNCCFKRKDKVIPAKKMDYYPTEVLKKSIYKTCLYPDKSNCSSNIINAHALQNKRILFKLSKDNHVIIMNFKNKPLKLDVNQYERLTLNVFDKVGVNDAIKYPCFCKKHDDEVFADIEKDGCDFTRGNKKQEFLFAYKAFIFEYYRQSINYKQFKQLAKDIPSRLNEVSAN